MMLTYRSPPFRLQKARVTDNAIRHVTTIRVRDACGPGSDTFSVSILFYSIYSWEVDQGLILEILERCRHWFIGQY